MRIEKINSNQIKCVLDKDELLKRHINVSELAYGSDKAQELFKDMMQQASFEFGFESDNTPLMIEAVPLSSEGIMLIITKVDNPDELEDKYTGLTLPSSKSFKKKEDLEEDEHEMEPALPAVTDQENHLPELVNEPDRENITAFFVYGFKSLDDVTNVSKVLVAYDFENDRLYRTSEAPKYVLSLDTECVTKDDCKVIRGILSEYGEVIQCRKSKLTYFDEHYDVIVEDGTIRKLSVL